MSEQVLKKSGTVQKGRSKVRTIAQVAMLGAVATVLMLFEFPIPFLAPPFYELDFSEVPVLIGAFAMGPIAGIAIRSSKNFAEFCFEWHYNCRSRGDCEFLGGMCLFITGCFGL